VEGGVTERGQSAVSRVNCCRKAKVVSQSENEKMKAKTTKNKKKKISAQKVWHCRNEFLCSFHNIENEKKKSFSIIF